MSKVKNFFMEGFTKGWLVKEPIKNQNWQKFWQFSNLIMLNDKFLKSEDHLSMVGEFLTNV